MDRDVEFVAYKGKTIAIIVRKDIEVDNVKFVTQAQDFLQLGFHDKKKGYVIPTHFHKLDEPISVNQLQEVLYIQRGKLKITFYTFSGERIDKKTLKVGDTILILSGAHKIEILEDSRILEVKQGPYLVGAHTNLELEK